MSNERINHQKRLRVCTYISRDMERDAHAIDGQEMTGRVVGTQFGNQMAAIKALADNMRAMSIELEELRQQVKGDQS